MIGTLSLPEWVTCADCRHCRRCVLIFGQQATDTECQWTPSKFSPADPQGLLARAQAQAPQPCAFAGPEPEPAYTCRKLDTRVTITPAIMDQLEDLDR